MDSDEESQATTMVTSSFAIDFFGDVTEPNVELEEPTQVETQQVVSVTQSNESPALKEVPPFKKEDADPNVPLVDSGHSEKGDRKNDFSVVPCDWLNFVIVVVLVCAFINVTSLVIGAPALYFSYLAHREKLLGNYSKTKTMGYIAVILSMWDIVYTLVIVAVIVAVLVYVYTQE